MIRDGSPVCAGGISTISWGNPTVLEGVKNKIMTAFKRSYGSRHRSTETKHISGGRRI